MITKQVRLTVRSKDKLSRLKGKTGIKNWNILSRWAFCYSVSEGSVPTDMVLSYEGGIEMSWDTFAGDMGDVYEMILARWCREHEIAVNEDNLAKYLCLHLERGIGYLSATNLIRSVDDLLALSFK